MLVYRNYSFLWSVRKQPRGLLKLGLQVIETLEGRVRTVTVLDLDLEKVSMVPAGPFIRKFIWCVWQGLEGILFVPGC